MLNPIMPNNTQINTDINNDKNVEQNNLCLTLYLALLNPLTDIPI